MPNIQSTCEVSEVFNGGDLPVAGALVQIGDKMLIPSPFVNLVVEKYRVSDRVIGGVLKVTLNGNVLASSFDCVVAGQGANGTGIKDILHLAKLKDCVCVIIKCSDGKELINGYGRIISASINEGNHPTWVNIAPYTIEIEVYENNIGIGGDGSIVIPDLQQNTQGQSSPKKYRLKQISEQLSWSINDDTFNFGSPPSGSSPIEGFGNRHIKLNFNMSVTGIAGPLSASSGCMCASGSSGMSSSPSGIYGLKAAEAYLRDRFSQNNRMKWLQPTDDLFKTSTYTTPSDHEIYSATQQYFEGNSFLDFRTIDINPIDNTINLSGEIIFRPSGCLHPEVFTTLNIEHQLTTSEENVTISGNIIGLINNEFDTFINLKNNPDTNFNNCSLKTKITNAESFLDILNDQDRIKNIAGCYIKKQPFPEGYIDDSCPLSAISGGCETTTATPPPLELCDMRIISSNISRNLSNGEINFTFNLSNSPNCDIIGASKVEVNIVHDKPHDSIVEIIIPGRGSKGALVQNLCCNSAEKYDISVDATLNRKTCNFDIKKQTIDKLRACAEKALNNLVTDNTINIHCWFKINDSETIGNTTYKLSRTYVKPSCP